MTGVVGIGTGFLLGLFGSGGTLIAMPMLHFILHVQSESALAMGLGIIAITATIAAFDYWRRGAVDLRVAGLFGVFGVVGTYIGARIGSTIPAGTHLALFAIVMYYSAARILFRKSAPTAATPMDTSRHWLTIGAYGMGIGSFAGFVGVGGGFLIVPALVLLWKLPIQRAVGTSLVAVAANSYSGFAGYAGAVAISYPMMGVFAASAIAGTFAGSALHNRLSVDAIRIGLGIFLATVATYILWQRLG
ncbi:MAG: sulfite exporter TauE/SafE family protein [Acidiferrobacter sp.]